MSTEYSGEGKAEELAVAPVGAPPVSVNEEVSDNVESKVVEDVSVAKQTDIVKEIIAQKQAEEEEVLPSVSSALESVADQMENLTIFGNKSLDELHRIQSKRSHLSAGKHQIPLSSFA